MKNLRTSFDMESKILGDKRQKKEKAIGDYRQKDQSAHFPAYLRDPVFGFGQRSVQPARALRA
jgi:hypothetical protein